MKTCLICRADVVDAAPTCPECGEGSFSDAVIPAALDAPVEIQPEPEAPAHEPDRNAAIDAVDAEEELAQQAAEKKSRKRR